VCIDEAQNYIPAGAKDSCSVSLIQFVKEGRNHGLSLLFTSQQPSAVHSEILSQLDSLVAHRLATSQDIDAVLRNAKGRQPQKISIGNHVLTEAGLLREIAQGQALVSHPDAPRAFVVNIRPRVTAHGGIEV
jgi:DNA helicase HerA-like ATPase